MGGAEEAFKSMSMDEFDLVTERITNWAAGDGPHTATFFCMKDAIELKKTNGGLIKAGPIDDLISDCYSKIYTEIRGEFPDDPAKIVEERKAGDAKLVHPAVQSLLSTEAQDSRGTSPTVNDSEKPEGSSRARKTGVRRPDILRRAELAVQRSLEPKAGPVKSRVGSTSSKRGSRTPLAAMSDDSDGPDAQVRREAAEGMDLDANGHDEENDGDDESDLSDAPEQSDEEMPPGLLMPREESSGEEADSESEGDEDQAEEAEEEEEEEEEGMEETHIDDGDTEMAGMETAPEHQDETEEDEEIGVSA